MLILDSESIFGDAEVKAAYISVEYPSVTGMLYTVSW
jgi:hypothetical protein